MTMGNNIELVLATQDLKQVIEEYGNQFDHPTHIPGASGLNTFPTIDDWFEKLRLYQNEATLPREEFVPSYQYLWLDTQSQKVIGMLSIRLKLNAHLLDYGGHIGYSIAPSEREKGHATQMLKAALKQAKAFSINNVLITCLDDNLGSAKVIENNQGILEDKRFYEAEQKWMRRYWIANN